MDKRKLALVLALLGNDARPQVVYEQLQIDEPEKPEPYYRKHQPKYGVSKKKQRR